MSDVCGHGSLVRKCEVCERDEEIAELKAEVERLRKVLGRIHEFLHSYRLTESERDLERAEQLAVEEGE